MSKLLNSSSPYIRSHANDLVKWYLWEDETFDIAVKQDKPILLSIGYFACHWCHVMQRESFNNPEIADYINNNFIPIKVDREQQPDIDAFYIEYVSNLNGNAGWPLNVFLTPEKIPIFGGTYYPPVPKYGRISFLHLLEQIVFVYRDNKDEIISKNQNIFDILFNFNNNQIKAETINEFDFDYANYILLNIYDNVYGGFGTTIKFPHYATMEYLIQYYKRNNNEKIKEVIINTLDCMINGGFYDLVDGGFHRYSTDRLWQIPHFEKMLYDNIEMIKLYLAGYNLFQNKNYYKVAVETYNFIEQNLNNSANLYYTSIDADINHNEGEYYLFAKEEIKEILTGKQKEFFNNLFNLVEFEGKFILTKSPNDISLDDLSFKVKDEIILKLKKYRENHKIKHGVDTKILVSNNCNYISAVLFLYLTTKDKKYLNKAIDIYKNINEKGFNDGKLLHELNSTNIIFAFLDDYAAYIQASIDLFIATSDIFYLENALNYLNYVLKNFYDQTKNDIFYCELNNQINPIILHDTPIKSPVAKILDILQYVSLLNNDSYFKNIFDKLSKKYFKISKNNPLQYSGILNSIYKSILPQRYLIVLIPDDKYVEEYPKVLNKLLCKNILIYPFSMNDIGKYDITIGKEIFNNKITYYYCQNNTCLAPTDNFDIIFEDIP